MTLPKVHRRRDSIDGSTILYHYLQKDLIDTDVWLFQMLTARLVVSLGIWLDPTVYQRIPIMLPFAARDPHSRGHRPTGIADQWGSADSEGRFRDDNSLVKGLPRALTVKSGRARHIFQGRRIGNNFTASHVWRLATDGHLTARDHLLYSFVPNLVWLPADVAKLSDREGSFVQTFLQAMAVKVYRHQPVSGALSETVEAAWQKLPVPRGVPEQGLPSVSELNLFQPTEAWFRRRMSTIESVVGALGSRASGDAPDHTVGKRYAPSLAILPEPVRENLRSRLEEYLAALGTP